MFDLPDAKRSVPPQQCNALPNPSLTDSHSVRREDLYSSTPDRDSSPEVEDAAEAAELRAKLNARLSSLFSLDAQPAPTANEPDAQDQNQDQEEDEPAEFAFRLFSAPTGTATAAAEVQKVVLIPDDEAEVPYTGPALSQRPLSSYIRGPLTAREEEQFLQAAVTGADVQTWAGRRAWGLEVPWRVTRISVVVGKGQQPTQQGGAVGVEEKKKCKRPGKKSRIVLRKKEKAKKEAAAAADKQRVTKEEHLKEKKKRLNRERKLKRRQKEREKKLASKGEGAEGGGDASSDGGSDEE